MASAAQLAESPMNLIPCHRLETTASASQDRAGAGQFGGRTARGSQPGAVAASTSASFLNETGLFKRLLAGEAVEIVQGRVGHRIVWDGVGPISWHDEPCESEISLIKMDRAQYTEPTPIGINGDEA